MLQGDDTAFGVVVVFAFPYLQTLRAADVRDFDGGDRLTAGICSFDLLQIVDGTGEIHLGFGEFTKQLFHLEVVRAIRLGLYDLPLILVVLAEFDIALGRGEFNAGDGVLIKRQKTLVAEIIGRFVERSFNRRRNGVYL